MRFIIEHLSKHYEKKEVLRDIDFTFEEGKIYGLLGRNGAGKTTLFNCINRDVKADGGEFFLETDSGRRDLVAEDIGYVLSTDQPVNYIVLVVSTVCMSLFFSVHYLTIYYLLQPYTVGTQLKGGTYKLVSIATYMVCYFLMQLRMPTLLFGVMTIVFCVLYGIIACVLVYKLAPKTFRLRAG